MGTMDFLGPAPISGSAKHGADAQTAAVPVQ